MKKVVDGEKYATRMYFVRDLDGPPLDRIIEDFVKSRDGRVGSKRKAPDPSSSGPMDSFVKKASIVVGTPVCIA